MGRGAAARSDATLCHRDTDVADPRRWLTLAAATLAVGAAHAACGPPPAVAEPAVAVTPDPDAEADPDTAAMPPAPPAPAATAPHGPLVWLASEEEASAQGRRERQPMLVYFDAAWCGDCKQMVNGTLGDPRVKTEAGRFVAVKIDATNDEDPQVSKVLVKYGVFSVPTLILLDSSGNEQRRFTDLIGPDRLLAEIDRVR